MIPILDHPPVVEFAGETAGSHPTGMLFTAKVPFERNWLELSLREAAAVAGLDDGPFARHVAESVGHYLRNEYVEPTITSDALTHLVRECLKKIGLPEVAEVFLLLPPPMRLSLQEVAESAGTGYELHFFTLLSQQIHQLLAHGARQITCEDLRSCVKTLRRTKRWRGDCRGLSEEIVNFIRAECLHCTARGTDHNRPVPILHLALS